MNSQSLPFNILRGMGVVISNGIVLASVLALAAAALVTVLVYFWRRLVAVVSEVFCPVVRGRWETLIKKPGGLVEHEWAKLSQIGPYVRGSTETKTETKEGKRRYLVNGHITGNRLCMVYRELTESRLDTGALLLEIDTGRASMKGYEIGYDLESKVLSSREYEWKKIP